MKYLKGTLDISITYGGSNASLKLEGFSDSDWGGHPVEFRSTSGFVFKLNGGPISWYSKLQSLTALSANEAEFIALSWTLRECLWIRELLKSVGMKSIVSTPTPLLCDNLGTVKTTKNPEFKARTKYIGMRFWRLRQEIELKNITVDWIETNANASDFLTKGLNSVKLVKGLNLVNMI